MTRIFTTLAWFAVLLVVATMIVGFLIGDLRDKPTEDTLAWRRVHMLMGVAAALVVVLVNSIVVTYFIGTSRWCKEVVETYRLDRSLIVRSTQLKRQTFPWAVLSMLVAVGIISLGAAADPGTGRPNTETWAMPHLIGAFAGLAFFAWAFIAEWNKIAANHLVIADILAEVKRIRNELGLEVEA